jgi:hypothetical protein
MVSTLLIPLGLGSVIKVDRLPHFPSMDHEEAIRGISVRCFPWEKNETRPKGNWSMFFSYLKTTLLWAFWGLTLSYCSKKKEMVLMKITIGLTYILLGLFSGKSEELPSLKRLKWRKNQRSLCLS